MSKRIIGRLASSALVGAFAHWVFHDSYASSTAMALIAAAAYLVMDAADRRTTARPLESSTPTTPNVPKAPS